MPLRRGKVWLFDLWDDRQDPARSSRHVEYGDADRAIVTVVPHTTEIRESPFEIPVRAQFLKSNGAFLVQDVSTYPKAWAIRKLGMLQPAQMQAVVDALAVWLGIAGTQKPD